VFVSRQCSIRAEYEGLRSRQMREMDANGGEVVIEIGLLRTDQGCPDVLLD
jgi:hypothetical protein